MPQAGLDPMPQHASSHSEVARYLKVWETVWGTKYFYNKVSGTKTSNVIHLLSCIFFPCNEIAFK